MSKPRFASVPVVVFVAVLALVLGCLPLGPVALAQTAAVASAPAPAAPAPFSAELAGEIDRMFAAAYPADEPGVAVLVETGNKVLLRKGYGMADLEMDVAIDPGMVFRLGSITKQITAAAVLLLVHDGKVELEAPLSRYLTGYSGPAAGVTVHQLLTHTGGVPSYTDADDYMVHMREDVTVEEMIDRFRDKPLDFEPGTDWHYSNSGYFLLGAIIEAVAEMSYADFLRERIFEPLGMSHTYYGRTEEVVPGRVEGYQGGSGAYLNAAYLSMTQPYSAGSLLSTVDDLGRWDDALAGDSFLPSPLRDLLWTTATLADGRSTGYGYGFGVQAYEGHRMIRHGGGINGFVTDIVRVPEEGILVVVLSNNEGARPGPGQLATQALTRLLGTPLDQRPAVAMAPETLDGYLGVYEIAGPGDQTRVVTREGDTLYTQRAGGMKFAVSFSGPDRFYYPDSLTLGRFERDSQGRVTGMWLVPGFGPEEHAARTDRPIPAERQAVEIDPAVLAAYPGRYELAPGFVLEVTREGDRLFTQATGQERFEVYPESATRFFLKAFEAAIEFHVPEGGGQAEALTLYQGGREMRAERID